MREAESVPQIITVWQALDPRKRMIVILASLAMFAAVYGLAAVATRPSLSLLYAGIDSARAAEVLTALDQQGVEYEVRAQAIYVDSSQRDELRISLAAQGLPANSGGGYEILEGLSGFGTTSQMFDAAYLRAKEGELARTIAALPNMRTVRVHISSSAPQGFRAASTPTASVAVTTRDGALSPAHAKALRFLVAAAVAGMKPDDVAVIDGEGGLIASDDNAGAKPSGDRAAELRENVQRLIEARVGYGKAVVEVAVETVTESEAISERTIDPQGRVAISSENEEQTSSSSNQGGGAVTVASNLPTGDAGGTGKSAQSNDSQTRERVNYEVSETKRELVRAPGAVKRLTVAVLVDGLASTDAAGSPVWQPRPEEELTALRDLVAAAVGYDESRGDVITIRSLAFEPIAALGTEVSASMLPAFAIDVMTLVQLGVLAIVSLVLGLFVLRPILLSREAAAHAALPAPAGGSALSGEIDDGDFFVNRVDFGDNALSMGGGGGLSAGGLGDFRSSEVGDGQDEPVARLRRLIADREEETVEILKSWMDDPQAETA
ncbi:MAG: flagellar basal-body MS-ring/collar protein FliF [Paracoccaceae bacterium]